MNILHEVKRLMKPSSDKVVDQLSDYKNMWVFENNQQETALEIIKNLLGSSPEFSGDDLLISADMDEMVSRDVLQSLKHCTVKHHTDIINLICMTWNFVHISASLSALCTNIN